MVIRKLMLKNWRNFRKVEVSFEDVTYLIGPNAAGKSNFLDVFRFLRDIASPDGGGLQKAMSSRGGFSKVRCLAARQQTDIVIAMDLADDFGEAPLKWHYELSLGQQPSGMHKPIVVREIVKSLQDGKTILQRPTKDDDVDKERLTQTALEQIVSNANFREVAEFLADALYLHLVPQLLKFGNELAVKTMPNDPFGQGFLEKLAKSSVKTRDSRLRRIETILKKVIHNFSDLKFEKDETGHPHLQMRYSHWRSKGGWQTEDEFSDGTLRLIALLWTLLESNAVILLEEPELSLHTAVVKQIPELIQRARASRKKSGGQIFISTHSPVLLDSPVIRGQYLVLAPKAGGEGTSISEPTPMERHCMTSGMTPAEVLFPKTETTIGEMGWA